MLEPCGYSLRKGLYIRILVSVGETAGLIPKQILTPLAKRKPSVLSLW